MTDKAGEGRRGASVDPVLRLLKAPLRVADFSSQGIRLDSDDVKFISEFEKSWGRFINRHPELAPKGSREDRIGNLSERYTAAETSVATMKVELERQLDFFSEKKNTTEKTYSQRMKDAYERHHGIVVKLTEQIDAAAKAYHLQKTNIPWIQFIRRLDKVTKGYEIGDSKPSAKSRRNTMPTGRAIALMGKYSSKSSADRLQALQIDQAILASHLTVLKREVERCINCTKAQEATGAILTKYDVWRLLSDPNSDYSTTSDLNESIQVVPTKASFRHYDANADTYPAPVETQASWVMGESSKQTRKSPRKSTLRNDDMQKRINEVHMRNGGSMPTTSQQDYSRYSKETSTSKITPTSSRRTPVGRQPSSRRQESTSYDPQPSRSEHKKSPKRPRPDRVSDVDTNIDQDSNDYNHAVALHKNTSWFSDKSMSPSYILESASWMIQDMVQQSPAPPDLCKNNSWLKDMKKELRKHSSSPPAELIKDFASRLKTEFDRTFSPSNKSADPIESIKPKSFFDDNEPSASVAKSKSTRSRRSHTSQSPSKSRARAAYESRSSSRAQSKSTLHGSLNKDEDIVVLNGKSNEKSSRPVSILRKRDSRTPSRRPDGSHAETSRKVDERVPFRPRNDTEIDIADKSRRVGKRSPSPAKRVDYNTNNDSSLRKHQSRSRRQNYEQKHSDAYKMLNEEKNRRGRSRSKSRPTHHDETSESDPYAAARRSRSRSVQRSLENDSEGASEDPYTAARQSRGRPKQETDIDLLSETNPTSIENETNRILSQLNLHRAESTKRQRQKVTPGYVQNESTHAEVTKHHNRSQPRTRSRSRARPSSETNEISNTLQDGGDGVIYVANKRDKSVSKRIDRKSEHSRSRSGRNSSTTYQEQVEQIEYRDKLSGSDLKSGHAEHRSRGRSKSATRKQSSRSDRSKSRTARESAKKLLDDTRRTAASDLVNASYELLKPQQKSEMFTRDDVEEYIANIRSSKKIANDSAVADRRKSPSHRGHRTQQRDERQIRSHSRDIKHRSRDDNAYDDHNDHLYTPRRLSGSHPPDAIHIKHV